MWEPSRCRLTGAADKTQDMLDQQPKTNHQVRQHPQPAAGQAPSRQLRAPGKPGEGTHSPALPSFPFVGVRMRRGASGSFHTLDREEGS